MGDTQDKMIIKKNGVIMILYARKVNNTSMIFYLKMKQYVPEGQVALTNLPEENNYGNDKENNGAIS